MLLQNQYSRTCTVLKWNRNHGLSGSYIYIFSLQRTKGPRQEIQMLTKQLEQLHHRHEESAQTEEKCRDQNKPLKHLEGKVAVNDFFQGRLGLGRNKVRITWSIRHFFDSENDHILLCYLMFKAVTTTYTFLILEKGETFVTKHSDFSESLSSLRTFRFSFYTYLVCIVRAFY